MVRASPAFATSERKRLASLPNFKLFCRNERTTVFFVVTVTSEFDQRQKLSCRHGPAVGRWPVMSRNAIHQTPGVLPGAPESGADSVHQAASGNGAPVAGVRSRRPQIDLRALPPLTAPKVAGSSSVSPVRANGAAALWPTPSSGSGSQPVTPETKKPPLFSRSSRRSSTMLVDMSQVLSGVQGGKLERGCAMRRSMVP